MVKKFPSIHQRIHKLLSMSQFNFSSANPIPYFSQITFNVTFYVRLLVPVLK
jgi:hypothetical protein